MDVLSDFVDPISVLHSITGEGRGWISREAQAAKITRHAPGPMMVTSSKVVLMSSWRLSVCKKKSAFTCM